MSVIIKLSKAVSLGLLPCKFDHSLTNVSTRVTSAYLSTYHRRDLLQSSYQLNWQVVWHRYSNSCNSFFSKKREQLVDQTQAEVSLTNDRRPETCRILSNTAGILFFYSSLKRKQWVSDSSRSITSMADSCLIANNASMESIACKDRQYIQPPTNFIRLTFQEPLYRKRMTE